jgi:hypothetical protein
LVEAGSFQRPLRAEFTVSAVSRDEIRGFLRTADRSLVF